MHSVKNSDIFFFLAYILISLFTIKAGIKAGNHLEGYKYAYCKIF